MPFSTRVSLKRKEKPQPETPTRMTFTQSRDSFKVAFGVESPSYQRKTYEMRMIQPCGHNKVGHGCKALNWWH